MHLSESTGAVARHRRCLRFGGSAAKVSAGPSVRPEWETTEMNRRLLLVLVVFGAVSTAYAETPTLKEARVRWLKGNYAEARTQYEALAKDPKQKLAAAIG